MRRCDALRLSRWSPQQQCSCQSLDTGRSGSSPSDAHRFSPRSLRGRRSRSPAPCCGTGPRSHRGSDHTHLRGSSQRSHTAVQQTAVGTDTRSRPARRGTVLRSDTVCSHTCSSGFHSECLQSLEDTGSGNSSGPPCMLLRSGTDHGSR